MTVAKDALAAYLSALARTVEVDKATNKKVIYVPSEKELLTLKKAIEVRDSIELEKDVLCGHIRVGGVKVSPMLPKDSIETVETKQVHTLTKINRSFEL